jgi:hypothetical protein
MDELVLNEEQSKIANLIWGRIPVRDASGKLIGYFQAEMTPDVIAELKRRAASPGPFYTGEQIQARLRALQEEWDRTGGFDEAYMKEFLARLNAADPGHIRVRRKVG